MTGPRLFCFGLGYSGLALARALKADGWAVSGTCRSEGKAAQLAAEGIAAFVWDGGALPAEGAEHLGRATQLLSAVPPADSGDPVLAACREGIRAAPDLSWIGYLSATSVYGDHGGAVVDEWTEPRPATARGERRLAAEEEWLGLRTMDGRPVHVFRLAGIYGPGRSQLDQVKSGRARRVDKPGHLFSRIHVDDIVAVLRASMARPDPGAVYNVCDDRPAASAEVTAYACELLGVEPPPLVPFKEAGLSAAARDFYADNKRPSNARMKDELGVTLRYPDYRRGLEAIRAQSELPDSASSVASSRTMSSGSDKR